MLFFFVFYILLEIVIFASVDLQCRLKILPFLYHCHSAALFVGFFFFYVWYRCRHWYIWGSFLNERSNIQPLWIFCMRFALISSCSRCWIRTVPSIFPSFLVTKLFFFLPSWWNLFVDARFVHQQGFRNRPSLSLPVCSSKLLSIWFS